MGNLTNSSKPNVNTPYKPTDQRHHSLAFLQTALKTELRTNKQKNTRFASHFVKKYMLYQEYTSRTSKYANSDDSQHCEAEICSF